MKKTLLASISAVLVFGLLIYKLYISSNLGFTKELINLKFFLIPMWSACLITTLFTPIIIFTLIKNISFHSLYSSKKN